MHGMQYREAKVADIEQLTAVRLSVTENPLPHPHLITYNGYEEYLMQRGKGWVCVAGSAIVGFAVVDLKANNIWALFVRPEWESRGIGTALQQLMLHWYFAQTKKPVWLGTAPHSRAETFYRKSGWRETGLRPNGEIRFEMTYGDWIMRQTLRQAQDKHFSKPHT